MALARDYKEAVAARIKGDCNFARAIYGESLTALLESELTEGLSILVQRLFAQAGLPAPCSTAAVTQQSKTWG